MAMGSEGLGGAPLTGPRDRPQCGCGRDREMLERASSIHGSQVIGSDCIAGARAIAPLIAEHAGEIEQTQALPPAVLDALHGARLFRMLIPQSCDGWEADPLSYLQAIE